MSMTPTATWSLATLEIDGAAVACLEVGENCYRLRESLEKVGYHESADVVSDLFDNWDEAKKALAQAAAEPHESLRVESEIRLAPVGSPGKIMCAGANYFRHLEEMGVTGATKENQRLFFFTKAPRNAIVGEGATVHMPLDTKAFDWEIELALVIGKRARAVSSEEALEHVAGYTVAVDFCARDLNKAPDTFYKLDWVAGKAQDTCCPIGPRFVPAETFSDPQDIKLSLSVNGVEKQNDSTSDMIFTVAEQIAAASRIMTLYPGDILLTGTPAGVGAAKQEWLNVGDNVVAQIEGIGVLRNTVQPPIEN